MGKINFLLLCLLFSLPVAAQTLKGSVTDSKTGAPVAATISVAGGKSAYAATDDNGNFRLKVPSLKTSSIMITAVGYKSQLVALDGKDSVTIKLVNSSAVLDDVIVIGYGAQRKSHLTGAISKLKNENLDEIPTSSLDRALIGKIAGVTVQNLSSETGTSPRVRVRGLSSISANSDPLVVVDGHPVPDGLSMVNPFDVESVEVLKDAASAAIYGSRGANGVIIITTKSGKTNKPRYTVKAYTGVKSAYKLHPIMSTTDYTEKLYREAALRENDPTVSAADKNLVTPQELARYLVESTLRNGQGTDWQHEAMQDARMQNVQIGVSGGKEIRYYVSGNYQRDEGIMIHNSYDRINMKAKIDGNLSKAVKFGINFNPSYTKTELPAVNFTDYYRFYSGLPVKHTAATAAFVNQNPTWANIRPGDWAQPAHFSNLAYQGYLPDGSFYNSYDEPNLTEGKVIPFSSGNNTPRSVADRQERYSYNYRLLTGADLSISFMKNLDLKSSLSVYFNQTETNTFEGKNSKQDGLANKGIQNIRRMIDLLWENTLNYNKSFGDHNFTGLLGFTAQKTNTSENQITGMNLPTDDIKTLNLATAIDMSGTYTLRTPVGLLSYLGRVTYDYKGKYLMSASLRTDGSGYFPKGHKYGWFPAASLGWRISSEPFMENINWLSNLKLRTSYGATGNNRIEPFAYLELLNPANYSFGGGTGTVNNGQAPNNDVLPNILTWERTFQYNAGIDAGLFKDRITMSLEYYNGTTDRLLFKQGTMSFSGSNQYWNNIGKVRNEGFEIELTSHNVKNKNIEWSTSINLSANKNTLLDLGGEPHQYNIGERQETYAAFPGGPSIQFFGYKTDGVWLSDADIAKAQAEGYKSDAFSKYFVAGGLKLVDVNGDKNIDEKDRTTLGSPFPDFTWGFVNNVKYKGFDLNIVIQGVQGNKILNGDAFYNESRFFNRSYNTGSRWVSAANPGDGKTPYATNGVDWMVTDYVIEDGSYAALRSVILGYTAPAKLVKKLKLGNVRFYAAGENLLFVWAKNYRGVNPEARTTSGVYGSPLIDGYQRGGFPMSRTVTFGVDILF